MNFVDILLELLRKRGISKNKMLTDLSLGKNSFVNWSTRGTIPNGETLQKIANYFGVSVDYLLGKTDELAPAAEKKTAPALPLTDAEKMIFISYRSNAAFKEAVDNILRLMPKEDRIF